QHRPGERIEEELHRRVDPARTAPDTDDQVHRDQHAFEEHVEDHEVGGAEHAHHHGFQDQEGEHELADLGTDRLPACQDTDRRQHGGQQHEQHGDAVHAHAVTDLVFRQPGHAFVELEAGIAAV